MCIKKIKKSSRAQKFVCHPTSNIDVRSPLYLIEKMQKMTFKQIRYLTVIEIHQKASRTHEKKLNLSCTDPELGGN